MGYYIDLQKISIEKYKSILKEASLIPSWMVLKENIDKNMDIIKSYHIQNLDELKTILKNKDKLKAFSSLSKLPEDYLGVLRRVINGYHPKPNRIKDFQNISEEISLKLEKIGIRNTLHLFNKIVLPENRISFSKETEIDEKDILKLTKLTDISRIRWVNHTFAYVLYEAGYDTVKKVANADHEELYNVIKQLNKERQIYKAHIGLNDMKLCIEAAKTLSLDVVC